MIKTKHFSDELEVRKLCDLACNIRNLPNGALTTDIPETCTSRELKYTLPRTVVSNIARLHGRIHPDIIAEVLGKDRTSIYHYKKLHETQLKTWADYRVLFEKLLLGYSILTNSKIKFESSTELFNHLREAGVIFSGNPTAIIEINTGKFITYINTDIRNCGTNMEIIRLALSDYEIISINLKIDETFIK
mgnify:FL=1